LHISVRLLCFVQTPVVTSRLAQARMGVYNGHMLQLNCPTNLLFQGNVIGRPSCVPLQGYASSPELGSHRAVAIGPLCMCTHVHCRQGCRRAHCAPEKVRHSYFREHWMCTQSENCNCDEQYRTDSLQCSTENIMLDRLNFLPISNIRHPTLNIHVRFLARACVACMCPMSMSRSPMAMVNP
jgi:hypothetical protein